METKVQGKMEASYSANEGCLPRLGSIAYFLSPPKSPRPPSSFRESLIGPTPRKMATIGSFQGNREQSRRSSSIPRPTSKLTASKTTPPHRGTVGTHSRQSMEKGTPQTIVKPRTYSRIRQNSFISQQNGPPSSFKAPRAQPSRSVLSATHSVNGSRNLSGIRQQLPVTNYSRRTLPNLDGMVESVTTMEEDKTSKSLPRPSPLTKPNTSPPVTKGTSPVITQRQLMGPLGPPMPRSQTVGNLSCFPGSAKATPSPSKNTSRAISTVSQRSEVGVMNALAESRMTDEEIKYFNQVAKEVEVNRQRLKGRARDARMSSDNDGHPLASLRTLTSFRRSKNSSDRVRGELTDNTSNDSGKKYPIQGARLKVMSRSSPSISPPVLTPDSGVSMGPNNEKDWETNMKLVYFEEPRQYWRGRYSTLLDRLRSEDYNITAPNFASTAGIQAPIIPNFDNTNSFELDEIRRARRALNELRDCCRTATALQSFQIFEREIVAHLEQESAEARPPGQFYTHSTESKARLIAAGLGPKVMGMDKNIAAATVRITSTALKTKPPMPRSKTIGEIGFIIEPVADGNVSGKNTKVGWRRPSYLKAEEEVLANEMALSAERRARAVAASQRNARRSAVGIGVGQFASSDGMLAQDAKLPPMPKPMMRRSLPRKSSGSGGGTGTNAEMLKRVFSESVKSVRKMGRSFTRMSGSNDG